MLAARVLIGAFGIAMLYWAYVILNNIWGYNDSGTGTYIVFALVPGTTGALCIYRALRGASRPGRGR